MIRKTRYVLLLGLTVALALASVLGAPIQKAAAAASDMALSFTPPSPPGTVTWDEAAPTSGVGADTFAIRVKNQGDGPAAGPITITAPLGSVSGITYVSANPGTSGFDCSASTGSNISCTYTATGGIVPAAYDDGTITPLVITVHVSPAASNSGSILLTVSQAAD